MDHRQLLYDKVKRLITHRQLRDFVLTAMDQAPEYIWQIKASTSGKHHHGETQTEHVLKALAIAEQFQPVLEHKSLQDAIPPEGPSLLYAIVALHDLYKCGLPGRECRREDGSLATDPLHPLYPAIVLKDIDVFDDENNRVIKASECSWWPAFAEGVMRHMGPWSILPDSYPACLAAYDFSFLGFICDYLASRPNIRIEA